MDRSKASYEHPLLNQGTPYVPEANRTYEDDHPLVYDAVSNIRKRTHASDARFDEMFRDAMRYFSEQERVAFRAFQEGQRPPEEFFVECARYLKNNFAEMEDPNDFSVMMDRIEMAYFGYDVIQPLIDDPETTDVKICSPYDIRVRVKGKAYQSNAYFIDEADLSRFIYGLSIRNRVNIFGNHMVSFTDNHDPNYRLRFLVSSPSINSVDYPYLHIRKVPKKKKFFADLIQEGMLPEDVAMYLVDKAKTSKGIVFGGPPGSGKTTILNAFIEHIPKTRETLVIQENDELFTDQPGFMFKHIAHGFQGEPICTLEDLGKMALVEGCNEFVIGEVKGGEMRYAMTLINAGGHAALTAHVNSAEETLDKLADLVKYGSSYTFQEARSMLKSIDTIVYLEGYKVREILEVGGYDQDTQKYRYVYIYRCEEKEETK